MSNALFVHNYKSLYNYSIQGMDYDFTATIGKVHNYANQFMLCPRNPLTPKLFL